jgi:beta-lactamase superfamily II metal-dependent hydrolase
MHIRPLAAIGIAVLLSRGIAEAQAPDQNLRVSFVDVGQGDAIWISGPAATDGTNTNLIIDGGPGRGAKNRLTKYLQTYGLKPGSTIDCIIATHPHNDHYPGLTDVLLDYEVRTIIDSGFPKEKKTEKGNVSEFEKFRQLVLKETFQKKPSAFIELRDQPSFTPDCGDLDVSVLHIDSSKFTDMGSDSNRENNASIVVRLVFGGFTFLFMGDAEGKERKQSPDEARFVEKLLLANTNGQPAKLRSTVLKVAHHGSETSSTIPFMSAVNPDILVIMSGRKSFKGVFLPDQSVIDRYKKQNPNLLVVRTDQNDEQQGLDTGNDADGDDIYMLTDGDTLKTFQAVGPKTPRKWKLLKILHSVEP